MIEPPVQKRSGCVRKYVCSEETTAPKVHLDKRHPSTELDPVSNLNELLFSVLPLTVCLTVEPVLLPARSVCTDFVFDTTTNSVHVNLLFRYRVESVTSTTNTDIEAVVKVSTINRSFSIFAECRLRHAAEIGEATLLTQVVWLLSC